MSNVSLVPLCLLFSWSFIFCLVSIYFALLLVNIFLLWATYSIIFSQINCIFFYHSVQPVHRLVIGLPFVSCWVLFVSSLFCSLIPTLLIFVLLNILLHYFNASITFELYFCVIFRSCSKYFSTHILLTTL